MKVADRSGGVIHAERLLSLYLRRYFQSSPHRREQVDEWIPVMAAAYLGQGLTSQEEDRLISIIDAAL